MRRFKRFAIFVYIAIIVVFYFFLPWSSKINNFDLALLTICIIPLLRNGIFILRAYRQRDEINFHLSIINALLFLLVVAFS